MAKIRLVRTVWNGNIHSRSAPRRNSEDFNVFLNRESLDLKRPSPKMKPIIGILKPIVITTDELDLVKRSWRSGEVQVPTIRKIVSNRPVVKLYTGPMLIARLVFPKNGDSVLNDESLSSRAQCVHPKSSTYMRKPMVV